MKSLTKNIYTLTVLVAMLLLSCSKEDRYLCSDNDPTPLTTRSVVSLDSLNSGELVLLEETEELLKLKNLMARKRSSNVGAMAVGVSDVDESEMLVHSNPRSGIHYIYDLSLIHI